MASATHLGHAGPALETAHAVGARKPVRAPAAGAEALVHAPAGSPWSPVLRLQRSAGNRAAGRVLLQGRGSRPVDAHEREADRTAARLTSPGLAPPRREQGGWAGAGLPPVPSLHGSVFTTGGEPLPAELQAFFAPQLGMSLEAVRIHVGPEAVARVLGLGARAFTYGNHVWMARPEVGATPLLAHELAHVAQYAGSGVAALRLKEDDADPDKDVSLGGLDSAIIGRIAEATLGEAQWVILREFLRGVQGGLLSAPPDQVARIQKKWDDFGYAEAGKYAGGFALGILNGLWVSIKGLVEAVIALVKLPYDISGFLYSKVPALGAKYGPRIIQFLTEGGGIQERLKNLLVDALKDPKGTIAQFDAVFQKLKGLALVQVRAMGHAAAGRLLGVLEEPWFDYGFDIGTVAGQILFEVLLAVASDAIGNVVKEVVAVAGRVAARAVEAAAELFSKIRGLLASVFEWVKGLAGALKGKVGELMEELKRLLSSVTKLIEDLAAEPGLTDTGVPARIPDVKPPSPVLESRAVKPPARGPGSQALDELMGRSTGKPAGTAAKVADRAEASKLKIPEPEAELSAELLAKRRRVLESLDEFVKTDPDFARVRQLDPDAKFGVQGSVVRGRVGNPRKPAFGQPFEPEDFDLDFFVVSEKLPKPTRVTPLAGARDRLFRRFPEALEGLRSSGKGFSVKVFRPGEAIPGTFLLFE